MAAAAAPRAASELEFLSYQCPGLHGPESRMTIEPRPFGRMFSLREQIVIPLFQRPFVWDRVQVKRWWRDSSGLAHAAPAPGANGMGHGTGKAVFSRDHRDPGRLVCLDGQQRLTSMQLLLATLGDSLRKHGKSGAPLVRQLTALSFINVPAFEAWVCDTAAALADEALRAPDAAAAAAAAWSATVPLGFVPPGTPVLLPSFVDRAPFFELIVGGAVAFQLREQVLAAGATPAVAEAVSAAVATPTARTAVTQQAAAKRFFDQACRNVMAAKAGPTSSPAERACVAEELVARVADRSLNYMRLMFCEILNRVNFAQVFLWYQEKSLFSCGALLHNPNPGIHFQASDLARNLLLSITMDQLIEHQEDFYRRHWLEPLDLRFKRANVPLDALLVRLLQRHAERHGLPPPRPSGPAARRRSDLGTLAGEEEEEGERGTGVAGPMQVGADAGGERPALHVGAMEGKLHNMLKHAPFFMDKVRNPNEGVMLFARFQSFVESRTLEHARATGREDGKDSPTLTAEVTMAVLEEMQAMADEVLAGVRGAHGGRSAAAAPVLGYAASEST